MAMSIPQHFRIRSPMYPCRYILCYSSIQSALDTCYKYSQCTKHFVFVGHRALQLYSTMQSHRTEPPISQHWFVGTILVLSTKDTTSIIHVMWKKALSVRETHNHGAFTPTPCKRSSNKALTPFIVEYSVQRVYFVVHNALSVGTSRSYATL